MRCVGNLSVQRPTPPDRNPLRTSQKQRRLDSIVDGVHDALLVVQTFDSKNTWATCTIDKIANGKELPAVAEIDEARIPQVFTNKGGLIKLANLAK
jgi:hypothetical protein